MAVFSTKIPRKTIRKIILTKKITYSILILARQDGGQKNARVAQLVERDLAKVEAAGSSPVSRS